MSKKDQFRFSIKLDAEDEEHRMVASYLNRIGRKKSRVIVKAMTAWLNNSGNGNSCENKSYLAGEVKIRKENLEETEKESIDSDGGKKAGNRKERNEFMSRNDTDTVDASMGETVTAGTGLKIETDANVRMDVIAGNNANRGTDVNDSGRSGRLLSLDTDSYEIDMAEVALMRKNYNKLKKEG